MVRRKSRSSLVSQQKRLLRQLDTLSKAVTDMEHDLDSALARAKVRAKKNAAITSLLQIRERMKARINRKKRLQTPKTTRPTSTIEGVESNEDR